MMMADIERYAVVNTKTHLVENLIVWDGNSGYVAPDGYDLILTERGAYINMGFTYKDGEFIAPPEEVIELTDEQKIQQNNLEKNNRLDLATQKIVVWQTKLLIGRKLSTAEMASLNAWLDYIDAVSAIESDTAGDIEWPEMPS